MSETIDEDVPLDLPGIVRACCDAFDEWDGSEEEGDSDSGGGGAASGEGRRTFARNVFMIGEWFVENSELMAQFLALYQNECDRYGLRVCAAVGFWIRHFPSQFDAHPPLCALVNRLHTAAARDSRVDDTLREELDISAVPSYAWLRNVSVRNPVSRHSSLCFEQWSPVELANALGYIDYRVLSRVTIGEVKKYVKLSKLRETPILERSIAVFNSMSCWVQCMILSKSSPSERADIITKFVNVGKHLRRLANFNTLMAVVGGVTHSNIGRLAKTQTLLSAQVKKDLNEMTHLLSTPNNFANYRRALRESRGCASRIPIMGIHLKDLIAWCHKNNADQFERTARVSRRRVRQLANLLGYFIGIRRIAATLLPEPNMDLINTLKVSFDINYNENDIYELSIKREPKTARSTITPSTSGASTPSVPAAGSSEATPLVVFADWASGVCQTPNPDIVNRHISAMVDAVFKHYDHDRNDLISRKEFEQIAGNFPYHLDAFVTIDADHDGQISKSEMKAYFLELNKRSSEFRSGFRHNFQETTFLTPTNCSHCKKLLWGLIRQGLRCRDCALVVHESCKRLAIAECRRPGAATRQRTQSGGSDDGAAPSQPPGAMAVAGSAAVVGVGAYGASFHASRVPSTSTSSGISMGGLYEWLLEASPHHRSSGTRRLHNTSSGDAPAENVYPICSNGSARGPSLSPRPSCTPDSPSATSRLQSVGGRLFAGDLPVDVTSFEGLSSVRTAFRASFHRLLRSSRKYRSASETTDGAVDHISPARSTKGGLPSLDDSHVIGLPAAAAAAVVRLQQQQQRDDSAGRRVQRQVSLASEEVFVDEDEQSPQPSSLMAVTVVVERIPEGTEERLRRKIHTLTCSNERLRENFRRDSASLSPANGAQRSFSASLPDR